MSINKELFIEDLKSKYTLLQEVNYLVKNVIKLIDELNSAESIKNKIAPYINELKQYVTQNDNTTEVGGNLEVDGDLLLNTSSNLKSKDGSSFGLDSEIERYINELKQYVTQNDNTTEVGGNLEVDGDLLLNTSSNLKTKDGSSLNVSATKLYTHLIKIENGDNNETYTFIFDSTHDKIITSLKDFKNIILKSNIIGGSKYAYVINGLCVKNNVSHVCIAYPSESAYVKLNIQPVDSNDSFTYVDLNTDSNLTFTSDVIPLF